MNFDSIGLCRELGITNEQVAVRAFEIFEARISNGEEPIHGRDIEDWLVAETALIDEAMGKRLAGIMFTPSEERAK